MSSYCKLLVIKILFCLSLLINNVKAEDVPEFWEYQPIRQLSQKGIWADIQSHLPSVHGYLDTDKITETHESCHYLCSILRNKLAPQFGNTVSCLYVLRNQFFVIPQPNTSLGYVARYIPSSIRSSGYNLYFVQQQQYWNDTPLYGLEEWVCYVNGTSAGIQMKLPMNGRLEKTTEFLNYALVTDLCVWNRFADKKHSEHLRQFIEWHGERTMIVVEIADQQGYDTSSAYSNLYNLRRQPDCNLIRQFIKARYTKVWSKRVLGE